MAEVLNLMIVDDEPLVREGLKLVIGQIEGFRVSEDCSTGREAINKLGEASVKPDIIIMDVIMPEMDGLTALEIIKTEYPDIIIVILSGHDEFSYVKKAIKCRAEDYLLKPINISIFKNLLDEIRIKILYERNKNLEMAELRREVVEKHKLELTNFYIDLIKGRKTNRDAGLSLHDWNIKAEQKVRIMIVSPDNRSSILNSGREKIYKDVGDIHKLSEILLEKRFNKEVISFVEDTEAVFCIPAGDFRISSYVSFIRREINMKYGIDCCISLSNDEFLTEVNKAYNEARRRLKYRIVRGGNKCFTEEIVFSDEVNEEYKSEISLIIKKFEYDFSEVILDDIDGLFDKLKRTQLSPDALISLGLRICTDLWKVADEINPELAYWINSLKDSSRIEAITTMEGLKAWLTDIVSELISRVNGSNNFSLSVKDALKYIGEHYTGSITLSEVADAVNLSVPYFSTLLKKETKKSFIEHVLDLKMREAKKFLISTELNISEIAWNLGYDNPRYFSEVFKKKTKMSPLAYRKKYI